ncbi:helix-turn-helix domain-containing protein [Microbacterium sp. KNMS]
MDDVTPAQIAATRHLIGMSQAELAEALNVNRHAVKDWESGRFTARPGVVADLEAIRAQHDAEARKLTEAADQGVPLSLPAGPRPRGWYLALGARVLSAVPGAAIDWE